ncbi:MAG: arsenate reductase (glutaredoxin) [Arenicellales bacterium WSBS_2016_MAG_OTU3]
MRTTIYHNPRCSKSRQTLALLEERNIETDVVEYLKTPLGVDELAAVRNLLKIPTREMMRTNETPYKELGLSNKSLSDVQLIQAIVENPILLQRPIVVTAEKAAIGRPPENVLSIL